MDLKTAALLNANDPERLRVEQEICQTAEGREAWLAAVQDAEHLRMALKNAAASPEAVARALQIPQRRSPLRRPAAWVASAAAALLISLGGWWAMLRHEPEARTVAATVDHQEVRKIELSPQIRQLSLLAMKNFHERDRALTSAQDVDSLLGKLPERMAVPEKLPQLAPLQKLVGAKIVDIEDQQALLTRWTETAEQGQVHDVVLQQIYAAELNLPAEMAPVLVHITPPDQADRPPCDVLLWTRDGVAYMLVSHSADGCAKRALQTLREKMGTGYPAAGPA